MMKVKCPLCTAEINITGAANFADLLNGRASVELKVLKILKERLEVLDDKSAELNLLVRSVRQYYEDLVKETI